MASFFTTLTGLLVSGLLVMLIGGVLTLVQKMVSWAWRNAKAAADPASREALTWVEWLFQLGMAGVFVSCLWRGWGGGAPPNPPPTSGDRVTCFNVTVRVGVLGALNNNMQYLAPLDATLHTIHQPFVDASSNLATAEVSMTDAAAKIRQGALREWIEAHRSQAKSAEWHAGSIDGGLQRLESQQRECLQTRGELLHHSEVAQKEFGRMMGEAVEEQVYRDRDWYDPRGYLRLRPVWAKQLTPESLHNTKDHLKAAQMAVSLLRRGAELSDACMRETLPRVKREWEQARFYIARAAGKTEREQAIAQIESAVAAAADGTCVQKE